MKRIEKFLRENLPDIPVILEIGAHHAEDSENFLKFRPNASVVAFEADPRCIQQIKNKRIGQFSSAPMFTLVEKAVSDNIGVTNWYSSTGMGGDWDHSSSILPPKEHLRKFPGVYFNQKIQVETTTLDHEFRDYQDSIDFIWMDVQGAEYYVIKGGLETLKQTHFIWFECYDTTEVYSGQKSVAEIMDLLPDWKILFKDGDDYLIENTKFYEYITRD